MGAQTMLTLILASLNVHIHALNGTAVDETLLSSYIRSGNRCLPGPRLQTIQAKGRPFVPFVTLTEAHSGSTWFRTMLNAHPCIRSHGETLRHREELKDLWRTLASPTKTDNPRAVKVPLFACGLKGFFTPGGPGGLGPKGGARHDFNPTNPGVFAPVSKFLSDAEGIGVVIWLRRNPLDRYLSFLREDRTGKPHCQSKAGCDIQRVRELVFEVPLAGLTQFLDTASESDKAAEAMLGQLKTRSGGLRIPVLELRYEDLTSDDAQAWWRAVLQFIGISGDDVTLLQSDWRKQITKSHKDLITNYDQVREKLERYKGGAYLHLL